MKVKIEIDTENTATVEGLKNLSNLVKEQVIEILDKVKETQKENQMRVEQALAEIKEIK